MLCRPTSGCRPSPRRLLTGLGIAMLLGGCGGEQRWWPPAETATALRMFPTASLPALDVTRYRSASPDRSWDLAIPTERAVWVPRGSGVATVASGYRLDARRRGPGSAGRLIAAVDLRAGDADALLVSFSGRRAPTLRLDWGVPGQPCKKGDVRHPAERTILAGPSVARFELVGDPQWRGRVRRLCLSVLSNPEPVVLERIALVRDRYTATGSDGSSADGRFRIRVGAETRPGLIGAAEKPAVWPIEVPRSGRLVFGFGATARGAGEVEVSAVADGEERTLFHTSVGGDGELVSGRWHDQSIELTEFAGRNVELRFKTAVEADNRGLLVLSEPSVLAPVGATGRPNLVLISLDTLRPDHLSLYGYERPTSPRIDSWAGNGVVFEQAVSSAPWTLPAHLSMLTGLDALRHGVNHRAAIPSSLQLLAEQLRELGYVTVAVTGGGYMHPELGFDQGFDRYHFWAERKDSDGEIHATVRRALAWTEELADRPFFLFVHSYETHHPYRFREPYFSRFHGDPPPERLSLSYLSNGGQIEPATELTKWPAVKGEGRSRRLDPELLPMLVAAYDSGIAWADREIGRLLTRLEEPTLAARTTTVLTSDHGEALGEKGYASHLYLDDFVSRVPLVVRLPADRAAGTRIERQVGLIDIYPTLLEIAGETPATDEIDGRSLLPMALGKESDDPQTIAWTYASFSRRGIGARLDGRWKYTLNNSAAAPLLGAEAFYDLATDPGETVNLAPDHPRVAELRRRTLRRYAEVGAGLRLRLTNPTSDPVTVELSGQDVNLVRSKSATVDSGSLGWSEGGRLTVALPPGEETVLLFEGADRRRVRVAIRSADDSMVLSLAEVELPVRVAVVGARLVRSDTGETLLTAEWRGPAAAEAEAASGAELQQQLEALGYLN